MSGDGRERFLRAIAERITTDDIVDVHVFPPIRQGGRETGVAVVTARHPTGGEGEREAAGRNGAMGAMEAERAGQGEAEEGALETPGAAAVEAVPAGAAEHGDAPGEMPAGAPEEGAFGAHASDADFARVVEALVERQPVRLADAPEPVERLTVYQAHYRLTLKGPDRGKWEVGITEEADAPPRTVDAVVRGVHERAGGDDEPERLTGEAFRAALAEEPWTATR